MLNAVFVAVLVILSGCEFDTQVPFALPADLDAMPIPVDSGPPSVDAVVVAVDAMPDAVVPTCAALPLGLIGWWRGEHLNDQVSNRSLSIQGTASAGASGMVNGAFEFDGASGIMTVAPAVSSPADFTIEGWIFLESDNLRWATIYADGGVGFWMDGRKIEWWQSGNPRFVSDTAIPLQQWHHFAMTYEQGAFTAYLDGQFDGTGNYAGATMPTTPFIGGDGYAEDYLNGKLDELSIYDRALSATEIGAIWSAGDSGKCVPAP